MFDQCLYFNSTVVARLAERQWTRAFRPFALTPSQAFLLRLVLDRPGLLQRDIADILTISAPTATRLLHGLEAKRLVVRRASSTDARESRIYPTPAAVKIEAQLNAASAEVTRRIKQLIGKEGFAETVAKLRGVRDALG